jgi:hypothetical protein
MNTTKTKSGCLWMIVLSVFLAAFMMVGLYAGFNLMVEYGCTTHKMTADRLMLERVYSVVSKYRETHGRWPATIEEAAKEPGTPMVYGADSIFHRPWLYYPNAKPGTKEVLAAVPDVIRMDWLPFIGWQDAILADGTIVDFRSSAALHARTEKGSTDRQ